MPLISVPAVYDGTNIALLESHQAARPIASWSRSSNQPMQPTCARTTRLASWDRSMPGETTVHLKPTLADIHETRRSRTEPPAL